MAGISRALRGLKPFFGVGLHVDGGTDQRRNSEWSSRSVGSSTLVASESSNDHLNGLSRTLRSAASLLYVKQPKDDTPEVVYPPESPRRKHARPSLNRLTWGKSASKAFKHKSTLGSVNHSEGSNALYDLSGSSPTTEVPFLDIKIPDSSLRGKRDNLFDDQSNAPDDPATIFQTLVEEDWAESQGWTGNQYASTKKKEEAVPLRTLESIAITSTNVAQGLANNDCLQDTKHEADIDGHPELGDRSLSRNGRETPPTRQDIGAHVQFQEILMNNIELPNDHPSTTKKSGPPEVTPISSAATEDVRRRKSTRFPIRKRLSLKQSLERMHTRISDAISPSKLPTISCELPSDANACLEELKYLDECDSKPSMGSRAEWEQSRAKRDERYRETLASSLTTLSDDNSDEDLRLHRTRANASFVRCRYSPISSNIRCAVEAIDKCSGDQLGLEGGEDCASNRFCAISPDTNQPNGPHSPYSTDDYPDDQSLSTTDCQSTSITSQSSRTLFEDDIGSFGHEGSSYEGQDGQYSSSEDPNPSPAVSLSLGSRRDAAFEGYHSCGSSSSEGIPTDERMRDVDDMRCTRMGSPISQVSSTESEASSMFRDIPDDAYNSPLRILQQSSPASTPSSASGRRSSHAKTPEQGLAISRYLELLGSTQSLPAEGESSHDERILGITEDKTIDPAQLRDTALPPYTLHASPSSLRHSVSGPSWTPASQPESVMKHQSFMTRNLQERPELAQIARAGPTQHLK